MSDAVRNTPEAEYDYTTSPATRVTTVRLPLDLARDLEIVARVDRTTQTAVIVAAIDHYIKVRTSTAGFRAAAASLLARDQARAAALGVDLTTPPGTRGGGDS